MKLIMNRKSARSMQKKNLQRESEGILKFIVDFMYFNTLFNRACNYRMEIDRLHVKQDLFGDKSSLGFLTFRFVPGATAVAVYP